MSSDTIDLIRLTCFGIQIALLAVLCGIGVVLIARVNGQLPYFLKIFFIVQLGEYCAQIMERAARFESIIHHWPPGSILWSIVVRTIVLGGFTFVAIWAAHRWGLMRRS